MAESAEMRRRMRRVAGDTLGAPVTAGVSTARDKPAYAKSGTSESAV
jgi:hypothetical protein